MNTSLHNVLPAIQYPSMPMKGITYR